MVRSQRYHGNTRAPVNPSKLQQEGVKPDTLIKMGDDDQIEMTGQDDFSCACNISSNLDFTKPTEAEHRQVVFQLESLVIKQQYFQLTEIHHLFASC